MQGSKSCEGKLFYQISLESLVPADHLVRRLAEVLDLSWIRPATAALYSHTGRPSIDPVVVAKMMILGFFYNIASERQLMKDIQVNLAYRWYLGYDLDEAIPNHSILSKARRRLGEGFFEQLFGRVLELCRQAGLIDGQNVLIDSTLVKANASPESLTALKYSAGQYYQQLEACSDEPDEEDTPPSLGSRRRRPNRLADQKRSTTDPEAAMTTKGKTTVLGYKAHFCADSQEGIITAVEVSDAAADDTSAVPSLLDQHEAALEETPRRVVADGAYGSQDCLEHIQERQIETVIGKRGGGNRCGGYTKDQFAYDPAEDVYRCPAGEVLRRVRTDRRNRKAHYRCDSDRCRACAQRAVCLGEKSNAKARTVTRFDTPYETCAQAACSSPLGRRLLHIRQTVIEGLFGQAKQWHGLRQARWRGLGFMRIQSLVTAAVLNLKKLLARSDRAAAAMKKVGLESLLSLLGSLNGLIGNRRSLLGANVSNLALSRSQI